MKNLPITVKFLIVLSLMAVTAVGIGYYAVTNLTQTVAAYGDLLDHESKGAVAMARMNRGMSEIDRLIYRLIAETDDAQLRQATADLKTAKKFFFAQAAVATQVLPGEKSRIDGIVAALAALAPTMATAEALALKNQKVEATDAMRPANAIIRDLRPALVELTDEVSRAADEKSAALAARSIATYDRTLGTAAAASLLVLFIAAMLARLGVAKPIAAMTAAMQRLAGGDTTIEVPSLDRADEIGAMARALDVFKTTTRKSADSHWVKSNAADIARRCLGTASAMELGREVIRVLTPLLDGGHGVFYLADQKEQRLTLLAGYAFNERKRLGDVVAFGEGLTGQCVVERAPIILTEVPPDYVRIGSALGEARPSMIVAVPILSGAAVAGVIEIATFRSFSEAQRALLEEVLPVVALHLEIHARRSQMQELLERTQRQAEDLRASEEELQAQSEELRVGNEELQEKTVQLTERAAELRASEEELRAQSDELQATNEALTEKTRALEAARAESETRAHQLGQASRYKSEFLANMSHELRTPLNSLLILSRTLADNREATLTPDQVESAQVIHDSGSQLLRLINDILDLSKIESGRVELTIEAVAPANLIEPIERRLRPMAEAKGLAFTVEIAPDLPNSLTTDIGKFEQVAANLISNAVKFTEHGAITVRFAAAAGGAVALTVADTGIGIPDDKRDHIFLPFEQVDGTTSRRYGGTGLGLAISKKLARLLGGDIGVDSTPGTGSTFTLTIPAHAPAPAPSGGYGAAVVAPPPATAAPARPAPPVQAIPGRPVGDDPATVAPGEPVVLVIEDDVPFARILADTARRRGFRCLVAVTGAAGLQLAREHLPIGIILDVGLPDIEGWAVMDRLKEDTVTRHIPVHFMSATDGRPRGLGMGAVGYLTKPVTREQIDAALDRIGHFSPPQPRRLLVVDDDPGSRRAITALVGTDMVTITTAATGLEALEALRRETFDCVVLDLGLPDLSGTQLLDEVANDPALTMPPVVIYSAKELSADETRDLRRYTDSIVIKGARSPERLLDEVTLFLHSVQSSLPEEGRRMLQRLHDPERCFAGKTVLLVEDDMRNAFALSRVLHARGLTVLMAADGRKALKHLEDKPDIDIVLMDIMMPDMDGYETTRAIRRQPRFRTLPILALTAKAMAEDREKCLEAGANDYTTKPIDIDRLLSLMRVWLHR